MSIIYYYLPTASERSFHLPNLSTFKFLLLIFVIGIVIWILSFSKNLKPRYSYKDRHFYDIKQNVQSVQTVQSRFDLNCFRIFIAPASGPRGFITMGFDESFVKLYRQTPSIFSNKNRWFVGGSTAALRFVALISSIVSGNNHSRMLQECFTDMTYRDGDTPEVLTPMMMELISVCAPKKLLSKIIKHPYLHLCIFVIRLRNMPVDITDWKLKGHFLYLFLINMWSSQSLCDYVDTICFYSGKESPPIQSGTQKTIIFEPLTVENIRDVLRATTCIPFVSERVCKIGSKTGLFFDGAFCHYQYNLDCTDVNYPALYLGDDHKNSSIKPTIFDFILPWRNISKCKLKYCFQVFPTEYFKSQIPECKFPEISDWFESKYIQSPECRKRSWLKAYQLSVHYWEKELNKK